MTRGEFLKRNLLKFSAILAMLGLIVYTVSHAFGSSAGSLMTIPVRAITDAQITSARAYLFRDEEVLTSAQTGLIDELVESGAKVGKNVKLATVCQSTLQGDALAEAQNELDNINRTIRILQKSEIAPGTPLSQAEGYRAASALTYLRIRTMIVEGGFSRLPEIEDELLVQLNRYLLLTGKSEELTSLLEGLRERKAALLGSVLEVAESERSSGTFYNGDYVDGYENVFTLASLQDLNAERFAALKDASPEAEAETLCTVGKMVYGYSWYLVMEIDASLAPLFAEGDVYTVNFPENEDRSIRMTLERLQEEGERALMVLRSDNSPANFVYYRAQTVEIAVGETEGFYIPETALQTVNGVEGVFIFEESTVRFRRIDVIYRGDGYCIVAQPQDSETTQIKLNDVLITAGQNLYDGKVYQ